MRMIDERVEQRRRRTKRSENPVLLDVMLDMAESESSKIQDSRLYIKSTILNMLVGGAEMSSVTIEWAMIELLRKPQETFRLHPVGAFMVSHESTEGCNVGGYYIPPKTRLLVNVWAMGTDESIWEDPLEFKPERFIGSSIDLKGQHFELLAFGAGRRGCPGMSMGTSVVHLAVAQLIHCFDWSVEGEVSREEEFGLNLPIKFPLSALASWRLTTAGPP
ncbi:hypothetical protein SUGI_0958230 [Cryptomeria japonica]|nr:hypothetical protein SUGI_0958230 [Cryptomeria japonica]